MEPLLIGGFLIFLVGSTMLGMAMAGLKTGVGHSLLIQTLGIAMMAVFFLQAGEFGLAPVQQVVATVGGQVARDLKPQNTSATLAEEKTVAATTDAPVDTHAVIGDETPVAAIVAAPEKAVDDKPIYKCTGQDGKETFSAKPCAGAKNTVAQ